MHFVKKVLLVAVALAPFSEIFSVAIASPIVVDDKQPYSDSSSGRSRALRNSAKTAQEGAANEDHAAPSAQQHDAEIILAAVSGMIPSVKNDDPTAKAQQGGIESTATNSKMEDVASTAIQKQQGTMMTTRNNKISSIVSFPSRAMGVGSVFSPSREDAIVEGFLDLQELSTTFELTGKVLSMIDTTDLPMFQPLVAQLRELTGQASASTSEILSRVSSHHKLSHGHEEFWQSVTSSTNQKLDDGDDDDGDDNGDSNKSARRRRRLQDQKKHKGKRFDQSSSPKMHNFQHLHDAMLNGDMDFVENMLQQHAPKSRVSHGRMLSQDADSEKEKQCRLLVDCASKMSLYDLVISFYEDDIDFDKGKFDKNVTRFDDKELFAKQENIKDAVTAAASFLGSSGTVFKGDACDELLKQFHTVEEKDDFSVWRGTPVTEVCLAEGSLSYVNITEISTPLGADVGIAITENLLSCAKRIFDKRPMDKYGSDTYVFEDEATKAIRLPVAVKDITMRSSDQPHGQPQNVSATVFYDFNNVFGTELASVGYPWADAKGEGSNPDDLEQQCKNAAAEYYNRILLSPVQVRYPDINIQCFSTDNCCNGVACSECRQFSCKLVVSEPPQGIMLPTCGPGGAWRDDDAVGGNTLCKTGCGFYSISSATPVIVEMDTASKLVFGKETSVGEICGIAEAVEDSALNATIPGSCCLDTPFSSEKTWGTEFTCKDTCTKFAPYFSGINEDACSIYGGKWCPSLPDCSFLKVCVANATRDAETNNMTGTVAYRKYLELSPNISDVMSIEECGNARAYFGFDPFFPNDKQICDDVKQLRLTPDFEILNSFATGGSGTDSSDEGLMKPATPDYSEEQAKVWRVANFVIGQRHAAAEAVFEAVTEFECPEDVTGAVKTTCATTKNVLTVAAFIIKELLRIGLDFSVFYYDETIGTSEVQDQTVVLDTGVIFENMMRIYTREFEILNTTNEIRSTANEIRSTANDIRSTANDIRSTANDIKEYTRYPDFTPGVKFAGCDGVDQNTEQDDGPGRYKVVDECEEDNYPPELVLLERLPVVNVDNGVDVFRLEKSFSKEDEAISYLESATQVIDDCSGPELLTRKVELVSLSCSDSEFKVTPIQEQCADSGNFLEGTPMIFLLDVDKDAPVVSCGFNQTVPEGTAQLTRWVDGNNLFLRLEGGGNWNPVDAGLFYEVTDNCPGGIDVRISVKSNENAVSVRDNKYTPYPPALLSRKSDSGSGQQASLIVAATSCDEQDPDSFCVQDPSTIRRFYEVDVVATDKAGNSGNAVCKIVVVPKHEFDHEFPPSSGTMQLPDEIMKSEQRFDAADLSLRSLM